MTDLVRTYDLPNCEHAHDLTNIRITHISTADPHPPAQQTHTATCLICGKVRRTEYRNGVRIP